MKPENRDLLTKALTQVAMEEVSYFEQLDVPTFELPDEFHQRTEKLIRRYQHWTWGFVKTTRRRVLTVCAAILLACAMAMSISAVRTKVFEFFIEIHEKCTEFFVKDTERTADTINTRYTATWLPSEYELMQENSDDWLTTTVWSDGNNNIRLTQSVAQHATHRLDTENNNYTKSRIGNMEIYWVQKADAYFAVWIKDEYAFKLTCPDSIPWEDVVKIIESIAVEE